MNDYVIISDLHLGSDVCNHSEILEFLYKVKTRNLILNGDIFDNTNFNRLKKQHWAIVKKIRNLAKEMNVIWISGNHDRDCEVIAHLVGATFVSEYSIGNIFITHGDRFDSIIANRPILTKVADFIYRMIQAYDKWRGNNYYYSTKIKRKSKTFTKAVKDTIEQAVSFASKNGYKSIIIGHLHVAEYLNKLNVDYYNSGSWTDKECHYVEIKQDKIKVKQFVPSKVPDRKNT